MTPSQVEQERLANNKTLLRMGTIQYYGRTIGNSDAEIFIDGIPGKRLLLPPECALTYLYHQAVCDTGNNTSVGYRGQGTVTRTADTSSTVANQSVLFFNDGVDFSGAGVSADDSLDSLVIIAYGGAGRNLVHNVIMTISIAHENRIITF